MPRVKLFDENEVLNKAMDLFWKQGYSATSVQNLVSHLGINRASLYNTFGDKEKLFKKAFEHYRKINIEGLSQFFQSHSGVKEGFSKLFEIAIEEAIKDKDKKGCFVVNTTTELVPGEQQMFKVLQENKKTIEGIFYEFLLKGEQNGEIPKGKDLKAISNLLFTFYSGLKVVAKIQTQPNELSNSVDEILLLLD